MHDIILYGILAVIIIFQVTLFIKSCCKQRELRNIFTDDCKNDLTIEQIDEDTSQIISKHSSPSFNTITNTINDYLYENKGAASDFHLIKDVVDRNSDTIEEEINTLAPMPVYLGLVGTMFGIILGVGFLIHNGGLDALLNTGQATSDANPGEGITSLLRGVAIAMVSSIVGILLTTISSYLFKGAKRKHEQKKHSFLSWIQIRLLPTIDTSILSVIDTLQKNLTKFNSTFSHNINAMGDVFEGTRQSHQDQIELMEMIRQIDVNKTASANIKILKELQNSTQQIEQFNQYLHRVNTYTANVEALNRSLDEHLDRTKLIEKMGQFFENEIKQIEERKGYISDAAGSVHITLNKAIGELKENSEKQIQQLIEHTSIQNKTFAEAIDHQQTESLTQLSSQKELFAVFLNEQQELFEKKFNETNALIEEVKGLTAVQESLEGINGNIDQISKQKELLSIKSEIASITTNTANQNKKIDELNKAIQHTLSNNTHRGSYSGTSSGDTSSELILPTWIKVAIGLSTLIICTVGVIEIAPKVIELFNTIMR